MASLIETHSTNTNEVHVKCCQKVQQSTKRPGWTGKVKRINRGEFLNRIVSTGQQIYAHKVEKGTKWSG